MFDHQTHLNQQLLYTVKSNKKDQRSTLSRIATSITKCASVSQQQFNSHVQFMSVQLLSLLTSEDKRTDYSSRLCLCSGHR